MKTLQLIITLLAVTASQMVSAHALWIETSAWGSKNTKQDIKIYYGEYSQAVIEPVDKWYSDVRDFKLHMLSPSQKKTEISKVAQTDNFLASFTPEEEGTYIIYIEHPAKDAYKTTAYEFLAIASVHVGKHTSTAAAINLAIELEPKHYKLGDIVSAKIMRKNVVFADAAVDVIMPDGWVKSLKSDEQGLIYFKAPLTGKYLLEVSDTENTNIRRFGTQIEKIWRANTAVLEVN